MTQLLTTGAKPFLKWAGGKTQLLEQMANRFPSDLRLGKIKRYIEPFVGGGAVFFHIAQNYDVQEFHLFDVNDELLLAYQTVKADVECLIDILAELEFHYHGLDEDSRRAFFYEMRERFNSSRGLLAHREVHSTNVERTAQLIFLNKTCFNGLFRVNSKSEFNVPFGRYKNPAICQPNNLRAVSAVLQRAEIHYGDFSACAPLAGADSFVYFDPPYRPISKTASFTAYANGGFDDTEQDRLASVYRELGKQGAKLMLSNSDPKNENPADDFFEQLYSGFNVSRVTANRMISCDGKGRSPLNELLVTNYRNV